MLSRHTHHALLPLFALFMLPLANLQAQIRFSGSPIFAYSSETGFMGGAFSYIKYEAYSMPQQSNPDYSLSLLSNTIYSQKKQFLIVLIPRYELPDKGLEIGTDLYFKLWPDDFFGIGNATDADVYESYTSALYSLEAYSKLKLPYHFKVSPILSIGKHEVTKSISDGILENIEVLGKEPSTYSGIGYSIAFDNSNDGTYPTKGYNIMLKQIHYLNDLGSDFAYVESKADARAYFPITSKITLALQSDLVEMRGKVPFYNYLELGNRLRAFPSKRFIDKVRIAGRAEQRVFPFDEGILKRIGFVVFAETGRVASELDNITSQDWHYSMGGGLRFSFLPDEKLNLRMDFGYGDDSVNFIVNAREVF